MNKGKLHLVPTLLGDSNPNRVIPIHINELIKNIRFFIVENERTVRRYLRKLDPTFDIDGSTFFILNKHTSPAELQSFLAPLEQGNDTAIISESGCPAIADPGAKIVELAHKKNIKVIPHVGPSSILLALMASGMNGQSFAFNGYLPIKPNEKKASIKHFEMLVKKHHQSQIFIETPYRNQALFEEMLQSCSPETMLCVATDVSLDNESIKTRSINEWKKYKPDFHKKPTVFILGSST